MGVNTRKPLLPAPTDSSFLDTSGSAIGTDLATDLSRRTDRTSYSIPDDGSPITISTSRRRSHRDRDEGKLTRSSHNQSQTSLLIEYFEGGKKGGNISSRPSVRVKVTPSAARKLKDQNDHIQISETGSSRKPSYTRRISLGTPSRTRELTEGALDDQSVSSITSAADDTNTTRRPPLEIELLKDPSEVSTRYYQPTSDISSMPADSMLDSAMAAPTSRHRRSHSVSGDEAHEEILEKDMLKTPSRRRSRSLSRERIAHKAAEKLSSTPRDISRVKHRRGEKSRSRSVSKELLDSDVKSSRKRSGKHRDKDIPSAESSLLSNPGLSPQPKSGDQYSFRSGTSKSSMNNPRLLETVEDAIRRLILPELKELKKDQKTEHNRNQFERDANASRRSASSHSRDEFGRRLSKHSSAPDVTKPRLIVSSDSHESGILLSEGKSKEHRREKHRSSHHDKSQSRKLSVDSAATDEALQRKRSKGLRDAEAAKIVGTALTAAALKHHDSKSSLDKRERRKKRSKTRSRSGSIPEINETEVVFQKHGVPQMPFRSDIDSELTRESILTQQTDNAVEPRRGEVTRRSPGVGSPMSRTPTRTPLLSKKGSKLDEGDVIVPAPVDRSPSSPGMDDDNTRTPVAEDTKLTDYESLDEDPFTVSNYPKNRALSPIQSVASYRDGESDRDETVETVRHVDSSGSDKKGIAEDDARLSIGSLSSAPSTDLARSTRPAERDSGNLDQIHDEKEQQGVDLGYEESPRESPIKRSMDIHEESDNDGLHSEHEQYDNEDGIYMKRLANSTDGSVEEPFDRGQQVAKGVAANVEYVDTPVGVESAVASLFDPSMVDLASYRSGNNSAAGSLHRYQHASSKSLGAARDLKQTSSGSPLKQRHDAASPAEKSFQKRMGVTSPPQSVASSSNEQLNRPIMRATALPGAGSPIPEIGHIPESEESEINTNPSIIQGPIGGVSHESRDHWPYNPTPPQSKGLAAEPTIDGPSNTKGLPMDGLGVGTAEAQPGFDQPYYSPYDDAYDNSGPDPTAELYPGAHLGQTSPGVKDEGYISAANPPSAGTPESKGKGLAAFDADLPGLGSDEPFNKGHNRHLSGYSHGMPSPLYDSATGRGIDRIQSKDIVALMDHLTVRDAQRNARDTEILVTLVRSAAEMRNSFEDMKKFIAEQDERLMDSNEKQHDRTQKVIGGPRPQPPSGARTPRQIPAEEDLQNKRKNIFKRALKGLSMKNSNDLSNIEDMLVRLLMEVEALRAAQDGKTTGTTTLQASANSADNINPPAQDGYEPEGNAGTSFTEDQAAFHSNSPLNVAGAGAGRRISPVLEDDEDLEDLEPLDTHEQQLLDQHMTSDPNLMSRHRRGGSVPLATPPRVAVASGALSNDTTPKMSAEKSRKHKSSSSSFFPKISRWSKTTASSFGDNIRNSIQTVRKERPTSEMSRSGSDLGQRLYDTEDFYDPQGDDRIRSNSSLTRRQENRPSSPLVPSQISENPKYQAHRNSLNLQHPQPRQGPTSRYQTHLESQAQNYDPMSPASEAWGSNLSLPNANNGQHTSGGRQSPISDGGYSQTSSAAGRQNAPPRPPKIRDEGPLIPQRPPKVKEDGQASYAERMVSRGGDPMGREVTNESPTRSSPGFRTPQRKPTGPRPITSSGKRQV